MPRAPNMWMNGDTSGLTLLALRTMPVNVVIKAFIKAEITVDDGTANSSDSDRLLMSVHKRPCSIKSSWPFSALIQRSWINLVSLLQRIK